jgi:hypothetical protein
MIVGLRYIIDALIYYSISKINIMVVVESIHQNLFIIVV